MTEVCIAGVGMTRFTRQANLGYDGLALLALDRALADAGIERADLGAAFVGCVAGGSGLGQRALKNAGLGAIPVVNIENACASGVNALAEAYAWIKAGMCDVALALGVELLSPAPTGPLPVPVGEWMFDAGLALPHWYALQASRRIESGSLSLEQLAAVVVKSRALGALNSAAHFQSPVTAQEVLGSRVVAAPLTLMQCCPKTDGAAAAILASRSAALRLGSRQPVAVRALALGSGEPVHMDPPRRVGLAEQTARRALEAAGVEPRDLDVVEVHDAFSIGEILYAEAIGVCAPGEAGIATAAGRTMPGGDLAAVNPSGGLLSRGHPLGASGLAMIAEVTSQLRGRCGSRQRDGASLGATHTMGANDFERDGNICVVAVLEATSR